MLQLSDWVVLHFLYIFCLVIPNGSVADHPMDDDLQGDIEHYSVQKQITRRLNKKSPGFLSAVRIIWEATRAEMIDRLRKSSVESVPDADAGADANAAAVKAAGQGAGTGDEESGGIDRAAFVCLMIKVHYLIICPPVRFRFGSSE